MSKLSRRLFVKSIIHLIFLIWQLGFNLKCGSADRKLADSEESALSTIYYQLKPKLTSFPIFSSVCHNTGSTYGFRISCNCSDGDGTTCHVTALIFRSSGLTGTIDEAVGDLLYLERLDLSYNQLHGEIPENLGNLEKLEWLDLSYNQLHGEIPENLGNLKKLELLYLQNNFLDGFIPSTLGRLVSLEDMVLDFNMLSGSIPDEFGKLGNLTLLLIAENKLTGPLPATLGNLSYLQYFWLPGNSLTGELPESYVNLTRMLYFGVAGNQLSGPLPTFVMKWPEVTALILQGNNFEGPIPDEYFKLSNLQYLLISDLNTSSPSQFSKSANISRMYRQIPKSANISGMDTLSLRNCSINGPIPKYISQLPLLKYLDLSFNNLTGTFPESWKSSLIYMSFASNNLTGRISSWIFDQATRTRIDLSYNNFSEIEVPVSSNIEELNLFACCRCQNSSSPNIKPFMLEPDQMMKAYFPKNKQKFHSLFINSGGGETIFKGDRYDADNDTARFHVSPMRNWAFSSSGDYLVPTVNSSTYYTKRVPSKISNSDYVSVYDDARLSPVSLDYYGLNLHDGNYEVTLHFEEIVYSQDIDDYNTLRKRIFDVYIQGTRELTNFNIRDQAQGPNAAINRTFKKVRVDNNLLHIQFYWLGKGSNSYPPTFNGPLLSAISVKPEFRVGGSPFVQNFLIYGASALAALLLLLALAWRMGWLKNEELQATMVVGKDKTVDKTVTLKELINATGNFSKNNMIGSGDTLKSTVYTAEPKDQKFKVAVKRLPSKFMDKEKMGEFIAQTSNMKSVAHDNLIKLWDVRIREFELLLVYEFMEEKSLQDALFGRSKGVLSWESRLNICLGVAKGLEHLHNNPQRSIVHGNIKPTNILLHGKGEVKLSDFGLVTVYNEKELLHKAAKEASRGFNPVEYFQGDISTKSDVFSFGMILLVIVSGRKTEVDRISTEETEFLLNKAYELKMESRLKELVDKRLGGKYNQKEALTILGLALECTQSAPVKRPTISEALSVLEGKISLNKIIKRDQAASNVKGDKGVKLGDLEEEKAADPDPSTSQKFV